MRHTKNIGKSKINTIISGFLALERSFSDNPKNTK